MSNNVPSRGGLWPSADIHEDLKCHGRPKAAPTSADVSEEHAAYLRAQKRTDTLVTVWRLMILIGLIALWELSAQLGWLDSFIFSSPSRIISTLANLYSEGSLFQHILVTVTETIVGFILGTLAGTLIAIVLWWFPTCMRVLDPYLVILNALPKIALGPILIVWIGAGYGAIVMMALLISLVVTIMNALVGFREVSAEKLMLMKTLGASRMQMLTMVVLPASVPALMATLKLNVGMSWVGVIVGEFLVSKEGLGYLIVYGGQVFKLDLVMASIVILCAAAALMYYAVAFLEKKLSGAWARET